MLLDPLADFYIFVWSKLPLQLLFSPLHDMWAPRHLLPPSSLLRPPSLLSSAAAVAAGRITLSSAAVLLPAASPAVVKH